MKYFQTQKILVINILLTIISQSSAVYICKKRSFSLHTLKRCITFAAVKHSIHPFKTERKGLIYVGTIISQPGLS